MRGSVRPTIIDALAGGGQGAEITAASLTHHDYVSWSQRLELSPFYVDT